MDDVIKSADFEAKQNYFQQGHTRSYAFRKEQLQKLKATIKKYEQDILRALNDDFNKPPFEAFVSEIGFMYEEINHTIKHLKKWMKPQRVSTPIVHFPSSSKIYSEPLGVVLIVGPWNYPFQLLLSPVVGAIAAGNCTIIKPSHVTQHTALIIEKIIKDAFPAQYISVVQGSGSKVVPFLLDQYRFDHVFFTGSVPVGQQIGEQAAKKHTSCTLELGGKSPAIIDEDVNIDLAAKRLAWGKYFNAGQTCVSPDYLLVHKNVKDKVVEKLKHYIKEFYGDNPAESSNFTHIVNERRYETLIQYFKDGNVLLGGTGDPEKRYIAPTLMDQIKPDAAIMKEEIFGPILPIITYERVDEILKIIHKNPYPLSLYLFTNRKQMEDKIISNIRFGGGSINNALVHLTNPNLPFGGVGYSGRGHYHGKYSFDTFSHKKSILKTSFFMDLPLRYAPYTEGNYKLTKIFFK
ncbi:MAG: aldehyde dehydrogenase [Spirochaetes bacterium]|nr:aldehyde dehydrogenase [Spirochaetota bacterium]